MVIADAASLPDANGLLDRIHALAPAIAAAAPEAERLRKPVDEIVAALEATGVFKSFVPKRFGGYEIDTDTFISVGLAVGEACTSTGWVTTFYMEHNWMLSQFPPETLEAVLSRQPYILAPASISPTGRAIRKDGGFVLTGRWAWGTGVMHSDWVLLNGIVPGDPPDVRLFLVPRREISVSEDWDCVGLSGTGSNDMIAEEIFVPEVRSEPLMGMAMGRGSGAAWLGCATYRQPMLPLLTIAAATPGLGAARRAVALFQERIASRTVYGTQTSQAEGAPAQIRLAHATARVAEAEVLLRDVGHRLSEWGAREDVCPAEERARLRLQSAHVVDMCRSVIRSIAEASGAGAQLRSHPMQRLHRDIHTLSGHTVFDLDLGAENYGRILLGLDPISPV